MLVVCLTFDQYTLSRREFPLRLFQHNPFYGKNTFESAMYEGRMKSNACMLLRRKLNEVHKRLWWHSYVGFLLYTQTQLELLASIQSK